MVSIVRGDLNQLQRNAMGALIVLDVHGRDVCKRMCKARVESINDFDWTCQLRYYWENIGAEGEGQDAFAK
jgi:dynein heavy chain